MKRLHDVAERAETYEIFVPWIARLGLGIALIGAGSAQVAISPAMPGNNSNCSLTSRRGFLLMAGLFTGLSLWAAAGLFAMTIAQSTYLIGNLDFLALCFIGLAMFTGKPGIDHLFRLPFLGKLKSLKNYVPLIARLGIGCAMIYLAVVEKLLNPHWSAKVVELYDLTSAIPVSEAMWVFSAGVIEFAVGLLLLIGLRTRLVSAVAFVVLSVSFFYFNEAVFSHITLFAILSITFVLGGGRMSLDKKLNNRSSS